MFSQKRKDCNKSKRTEFIVKESYCGTKNFQEILADILISEYEGNPNKIWTPEQNNDIINNTDNSLISCCSRKE
ncbi:MAG TPA: hypothetical protein DEB10_10680 [Ruminococcaceae bacterium]|nr:hypothetical protein [Oscillospiraceae bacterium]